MIKTAIILLLLAATLAVPFALRPKQQDRARADDTVVIITPHNAAIREEFERGFAKWYLARTGRAVAIDWRLIGGTSEIARYINGEYVASFRNLWVNTLRRPWSNDVLNGFANGRLGADAPAVAREARAAFLASNAGSGLDLFFGGGPYDFASQAQAGRIVDSGILKKHPEWFTDAVIPRTFAGEEYWDQEGRWVGTVISSFGIVSNRDSLRRLGIAKAPARWEDLRDPRWFGELALADPTKSGSINKAFENVVQQQMQKRLRALQAAQPGAKPEELEKQAVREGWREGMRLLQAIGANARYFTDSAQKVPVDVAAGDCAAGMCIDFFGRQQQEAVRRRGADDRLGYVTPAGGAVASVDPIALMRGAPHREAAVAFIEFTLSMDGQRLWNQRAGTPGGPAYFALRRLPVRKDFYALPGIAAWRSDPDELPYASEERLIYRPQWTGRLFRELAFVVRVMCLDAQPELKRAWRTLADAGMPPGALAVFQDVSAVDYDVAGGRIKAALGSKNRVDELNLANELGSRFRRQYLKAAEMAAQAKQAR